MGALQVSQRKQYTSRIRKGASRAEEYLGRVHTDIAGPREYEYTRAAYTRPLRLKLEAPEALKTFKAVVENESQKRMREIMADNARQLYGEMKVICEQEGITLHTSVRYSPESNGVAKERSELHDSSLPKLLRAEAFNTATYVHNRIPTKALGGRTPFEALYGVKPDVSHSRAPSSGRQND